MTSWIISVLAIGTLVSRPARADHDHDHRVLPEESSSFGAGVSILAAHFDTMLYGGDYQGLVPAVRFTHGRFAGSASLPMYRLQENGREVFGLGDAMAHGQVTLIRRAITAGVALALTGPTGDELSGLGMGHPMVMPAAWATWSTGRYTIGVSTGYGRALAGDGHHSHGAMPLVDPMNSSEVTWTGSGDIALARQLHAGAHVNGAVAVGDGVSRVIAGSHVVWIEGRVTTSFELQAGLAGDPFTFRGVLGTTLEF